MKMTPGLTLFSDFKNDVKVLSLGRPIHQGKYQTDIIQQLEYDILLISPETTSKFLKSLFSPGARVIAKVTSKIKLERGFLH